MSIDERMNDVAGSKAIELKDITKRFGSVVANYKVSLSVTRARSSPSSAKTAAARPR